MRPLKILHVASHDTIEAGGAIQMLRLAQGLKKKGHNVFCVFNLKKHKTSVSEDEFEVLKKQGITVKRFPMQRLYKYPAYFLFRRFVDNECFDVIHTHRFRALRFVYRSLLGKQIKAFIANRKNSYPLSSEEKKIYSSEKIDRIIVNASLIRDILVNTANVRPDKINIIYNGVDLTRFNPNVDGNSIREEFHIPKDMPVIGMIANFSSKKSHNDFFLAAYKVAERYPQVRFLLAGKGDASPYKREIQKRNLSDRFIFTGFRKDIEKIIATLDISVISSSKGEGLTGAIVEAMAMAKPVISTDIAGNKEFIIHRETGLLVSASDPDELASSMIYLLDNPLVAKQIGRKGYEYVKDKVDNEKRTQMIESIYYEILSQKGYE